MNKFKRANELPKIEKRVPISARVPASVKTELQKEALKGKVKLSDLIEAVLIDYTKWLKTQK